MRRLLITHRHVALDRSDDYLDAWKDVLGAVAAAGGRAWLFRGAGHEDQFIEFIEWSDDAGDPLDSDDAEAAFAHLASFAPARQSDEWEEVT
jgi:hypothetical protein